VTRTLSRTQFLRLAFAGAVALGAPAAFAQDAGVKLFKIVSAKDEIVVGVKTAELAGEGSDLAKLAGRMKSAGQLEVWRYAVRKADNGDLQQAPLGRVMLIYSDTLRIEPYATPLKVLPPA